MVARTRLLRYTNIACLVCDLLPGFSIDVASESRNPVHRHIAVCRDTHETKQNTTRPLSSLPVISHDRVATESRQMRGFIAACVGDSAGLSFITRHVQQASRTPVYFEFSVSYFIAIFQFVIARFSLYGHFTDNIASTDIFCTLRPTGMLRVDHHTSIFTIYVRKDAA